MGGALTLYSESSPGLSLFQGYGVELEYMIVDARTLDVHHSADLLISSLAGTEANEAELGEISCSNELALHVFELKTTGPAPSLAPLPTAFGAAVAHANSVLRECGARLMPTAMHPWMDPDRETKLWPHEQNDIYRAFDRIFGCSGHGWSNLQSTHINLPFAGDDEFGRLHAAIRVVLPLLPALAASSPVVAGKLASVWDARLRYYQGNCARIPSVSGSVIPEAVFSRRAYDEQILQVIQRDLAELDPEGVLESEWTNARGAIARFVRDAIEIRVLDVQENPTQDLAIVELVSGVLRLLVEERLSDTEQQRRLAVTPLYHTLLATIREGEHARIDDTKLLACLGVTRPTLAREVWQQLAERITWSSPAFGRAATHILERGTLSTRIRARLSAAPSRTELHDVYAELCECLANSEAFA